MSPGKNRVKYAPEYAVMQDFFPQTTFNSGKCLLGDKNMHESTL